MLTRSHAPVGATTTGTAYRKPSMMSRLTGRRTVAPATTSTTSTTRRRRGFGSGTRTRGTTGTTRTVGTGPAPMSHHARRPSMGDRIHGAARKLAGRLTPGRRGIQKEREGEGNNLQNSICPEKRS
jgi:hypothetical protein